MYTNYSFGGSNMLKKLIALSVLCGALVISGVVLNANNYNVSNMSFSGYMIGAGDTDWFTLQGQEGVNPTICLRHGGNVDFDIEVYNNGVRVGRNISLQPVSCVSANTPGSVRVKIWSVRGSGNYSVTINR